MTNNFIVPILKSCVLPNSVYNIIILNCIHLAYKCIYCVYFYRLKRKGKPTTTRTTRQQQRSVRRPKQAGIKKKERKKKKVNKGEKTGQRDTGVDGASSL